jgi:outer membrane receptor for ferrienterochelin and colicin
MKRNVSVALLAIILALFSRIDIAMAQDDRSTDELIELSFEELLNMEITSVSKKAERLHDVPSSMYVITADDIKRSSAQNLMQLLREQVPGVWAVANDYKDNDMFIRNTDEESMLILLDGTPLLDLTYISMDMESFDLPFEIIQRIEVIRGSGGTIYGANSASAVISIITKNPEELNKLTINTHYALPGKKMISFVATPFKKERFASTVYAKYDYFSGFQQLDLIENETSEVPVTHGTGTTIINNRFTENDNLFTTISAGYRINFEVNEKLKLSTGLNFVNYKNDRYFQIYDRDKSYFGLSNGEIKPFGIDSIYFSNNDKTRITGNFQADYSIHENHNVFFRVSSNYEDRTYVSGGGYYGNNGIVDFEIQDNIEIGFNSLSVGGNFRLVNYDMSWHEKSTIMFIEPNTNETLKGFFVQDKMALADGKINLYLGIKAENFSLINNKFYFSPMAKFAFIPKENITLWGGFTQSYTTPGFNLTNVEVDVFRSTRTNAYQAIYDYVMAGKILERIVTLNEDEATARAYFESAQGIAELTQITDVQVNAQFPYENINISAINGPNTVPTSFKNFELGLRYGLKENISFESNFYYSIIKDGIGNSPVSSVTYIPSPTRDGEFIQPYYYGNYEKGYNMGVESMIKMKALDNLNLELSHNYFQYNLEFQENDDFEIDEIPAEQADLVDDDYPQVPAHTLKLKLYYDVRDDLHFSLSSAYSSAFFIKYSTAIPYYQEELQRFDPLFSEGGNTALYGGRFDNRFILNLKIEKTFSDDKISAYIYANDFLSQPFVEGITQFLQIYPRQVGALIGAGVVFNMK